MKKKNSEELRGRKGSKSKGDYTNSDFQKIRILSYLEAHDTEETNQSDFFKEGKYGITNNKTTLNRNLGQMIENKWIIKTPLAKSPNVKIYTLTEKGHQMKDYISKLREDEPNHPLFDLDLFLSIKSLG